MGTDILFILSSTVNYIYYNLDTTIKAGELTGNGLENSFRKGAEFRHTFTELFKDNQSLNQTILSYCSFKKRNALSLFNKLRGIYSNDDVSPIFHDKIEEIYSDFINGEDTAEKLTQLENFMENHMNTIFPKSRLMFRALENKSCREKVDKKLLENKQLVMVMKLVENYVEKHSAIIHTYLDSLPSSIPLEMKLFYLSDYFDRSRENKIELTAEELTMQDTLKDYYKLLVDIVTTDECVNRLLSSKILSTIMKHFESKINNNLETLKAVLFSAHDTTLSALIRAIKLDPANYRFEFNDELNFVLYKYKGEEYISLRYNTLNLDIKFCEVYDVEGLKLCKFQDFSNYIYSTINNDEDLEKFCSGEIDNLSSLPYTKPQEEL
jgi:hypothetical protein